MSGVTERLSTALADRYRIERHLGAGGMATVYLAEDLKHKRRVAVKVLKPELAAVLGAERFVQEITTTASLSHPHILPLFDSGTADGFLFYVMPFIEGETLRDKLNRETQLGVDEAVKIATEVADALDYAHRHGVIHRDIKPENILLHDGRPMVADFGIALAVSAAAGGRMTETGLSLGTPHYMSPEQATAEKEISGRSDVYSLASVLYEMLAGQPPHLGGSAQQIIMKIIAEPAEAVTRYRKAVPVNIAAAVAKALEKLPADRFTSAREFAQALADPAFRHRLGETPGATLGAGNGPGTGTRRVAITALALVAVGLGGVWLGIRLGAADADAAGGILRFSVDLPRDAAVTPLAPGLSGLALSPDGRTIVAIGAGPGGTPHLFVRRIDELEWRVLPGSANANAPFFSPEGTWVAFYTGEALMKVPIAGGASVEIGRIVQNALAYGAWGSDDRIVISTGGRLATVPAGGGTIRTLPVADSGAVQAGQVAPVLLSDGEHVLYGRNSGTGDGEIAVASLQSGRSDTLDVRGTPVAVEDGILFFIDAIGALAAVRFDESTQRTTGEAIRVLPLSRAGGRTDRGIVSIARNGAVAYFGGDARMELVLHEIGGRERIRGSWPSAATMDPRFSPDGRSVALLSNRDIWIVPVAGEGAPRRLTTDSANSRPEWTPDGRGVLYRSQAQGSGDLRITAVAGAASGETTIIALPGQAIWQGVLAPDNSTLALRTGTQSGADVWYRALRGDTTLKPIATTPFVENSPQFSPDGKWIAYVSTEAGQEEIYLRAFPPGGAPVRISVAGGEEPMWSPRGSVLFYRERNRLMRVALRTTPSLSVEAIVPVIDGFVSLNSGHTGFDIAPDGRTVAISRVEPGKTHIVYVQNWMTEVRARLAAQR